MVLKFGGQPTFPDGSTWGENIIAATTMWNRNLGRVQFTTTSTADSAGVARNNVNEVFVTTKPHDYEWGSNTLAMTVYWISGTSIREADVMFNANRSWYSYRGSLQYSGSLVRAEVRRVALHELGHALGLDHPDEAGQSRDAIMNSTISSRETLSTDDGDGAAALYGPGIDNQPIPPTITSHPSPSTVYVGDSAGFYVSASGTPTLKYQWRRDGAAIAGATSSSFFISSAKLTDSGDYSVEVSNPGGAAVSNSARLTVNLPDPPTFNWHPTASLYTNVGSSFSLSVGYAGRSVTLQWYREGVAIPGATGQSYFVNVAKKSDAGIYTVVLTNAAGSVTSNPANVVVNDAVAPSVTQQPVSASAAVGSYVSFSIQVTGSTPLSYQWYFNGTPLQGAISTSYYLSSVTAAHAGSYTCRISNPAGETFSDPATLSVLAEPLNFLVDLSSQVVAVGNPFSLSPSYYSSSSVKYQWYKDGVPLPGATGSSYSVSSATGNHAGIYSVTITNGTALITSRSARVIVRSSTPYYSGQPKASDWIDLQSAGGIVYVAFATPGRIERYDVSAGQWLASTSLPKTVTALHATSDGVFVAFGTSLVKYSNDLATSTALASTSQEITRLAAWNDYVYAFTGGTASTFNRNTGAAVTTSNTSYAYHRMLRVAPTAGRIYAASSSVSPADVGFLTLNSSGAVSGFGDSPYHEAFDTPTQVFLAPAEDRIADDAGIVYRTSDLRTVGSLAGSLQEAAFHSDGGVVVLRDNRVVRFNNKYQEIGSLTVPTVGERMILNGNRAILFTQPASLGAAITTTIVDLATLAPRAAAPVVDAAGLAYTPDEVVVDRDGVVLLLSRINRSVFRWSSGERRYLAALPTWNMARNLDYMESGHRVLLAYPDGMITQVPLATGTESHVCSSLGRPMGVAAAGDAIFTGDETGAWSSHQTYNTDGVMLTWKEWNYQSRVLTWSPANRKMYFFRDDTSPNDLISEAINTDGTIGATVDTPYHGDVTCTPPIRVSPDGQYIVLGSGELYAGTTLQLLKRLAVKPSDAAWAGGTLTTMVPKLNTCQVQQWTGAGFTAGPSAELEGYPVRLVAIPGDRLVAVTLVYNTPRFYILDSSLNVVFQSSSTPPPAITVQPQSRAVLKGTSTTLTVSATGAGALTYQWYFNGAAIAGATGSSYTLSNFDSAKAGSYSVRITNGTTSVVSEIASVTLTDRAARFFGLSTRARVGSGSDVLIPGLSITGTTPKKVLFRALGPQLTVYGVSGALQDPTLELKTLSGVTLATSDNWDHTNSEYRTAFAQLGLGDLPNGSKDCVLIATLPPGLYTPVIAGKNGTTGIALVEFYDLDTSSGNLSAISARAQVGKGDEVLIPGIIVEGNANKKLLVRVSGPALQAYGVSGALLDPQFEIKNGSGTTIFANDNWNASDPALVSAISTAGAAAFTAGSKDSALLAELAPGLYTIVIRGVGNTTGVALVELFDVP